MAGAVSTGNIGNEGPWSENKGMRRSVAKSVDEYIAAQPDAMRPKLEKVRATIRKAVPEAVEGIGYGIPGYKLHGKPLLYFGGFRERPIPSPGLSQAFQAVSFPAVRPAPCWKVRGNALRDEFPEGSTRPTSPYQ